MPPRRSRSAFLALIACLAVSAAPPEQGTDQGQTLHDDFESSKTAWKREETDATIRLLAHDRSDRAAHDGQVSEHFQFDAGPGSAFYYSYALPNAPVTNALSVSLYVRSNRAGVQLKGRVVLPADKDPDTGEPSFVLVEGPLYQAGDRWQKLQLLDLRHETERQARILRASTRRPVRLDGAYLDRLVINLYGGAGASEVFLDDLTVTPVVAPRPVVTAGPPVAVPSPPRTRSPLPAPPNNGPVQLVGNRLKREGREWVPTAILAPGADVGKLRQAGFDVLAVTPQTNPKRIEKAISAGMMLMPWLGGPNAGDLVDPAQVATEVEQYPYREAVAFWHLGRGLGRSLAANDRATELDRTRESVAAIHNLQGDFSRLTTADVEGDTALFGSAPKGLDIVGVEPRAWGGSQDPYDTFTYLTQRRTLALQGNPGGVFWAWIPTTVPDSVVSAIWGNGKIPDWGHPEVQPEQVRLFTYLALAAGYRGIGFLGDADLTGDAGQMRLIELELLNQEIKLFESIIADGRDPYVPYPTNPPDPPAIPAPGMSRIGQRMAPPVEVKAHPSIRAVAIGTLDRKGALLLVHDVAGSSQFQPPQMAAKELWLTVIAPEGAQAFEFSPGGMRVLETKRGIGGRRIKVIDFALSSLILMTTNLDLAREVEVRINQNRSYSVQLAIKQVQLQYDWAAGIDQKIAQQGHPLKQAAEYLERASKYIDDARAYLEREDYLHAWIEARRAGATLRHLMRGHWEAAMEALAKATAFDDDKPLDEDATEKKKSDRTAKKKKDDAAAKKKKVDDEPKVAAIRVPSTSSPASVAFNTLPQHYRLLDWLKDKSFGQNLVPSGSFDDPQALDEDHWTPESYEYDGVTGKVFLTADTAYHGKGRALRMNVTSTDLKAGVDPLSAFLDFPPVAVRSPAIPVTANYLYRISVLVKCLVNSQNFGYSGVFIRDSIGGEALQYRTHVNLPHWTRIVIYRRAPEDGELSVTLGFAGYKDAYFDDFRIEQVESLPTPRTPDVASLPRRRPAGAPASSATRPLPADRTSR